MESKYNILIKKVSLENSQILFEWRNDKLTRSMSINNKIITLNEHKKWLKKTIKNANQIFYIGFYENSNKTFPIGSIRFNLVNEKNKSYEISIITNPELRGKGFGKSLLICGIEKLKKDVGNYKKLFADIKYDNSVSIALFSKIGFIKSEPKIIGFHRFTIQN